ncbi:replication initiation protein [Acinetobacter sp. ANC 5380]|uniref:Replication initiation protein n=1 Tax=Acinetobacter terrae TaxID=2731247 RepID=A0A7Y2WCE1_9GAMM|nr:replication initiation protein [Acinetobacter terrae]NNH78723.1 replication initiation protein [Acinetobacter terrae]
MKPKNCLSSFDYSQAPETAVLLKSNFLVDLEDYRDSSERFELTRMEWMLIQTAFYMTQKIKEKHGDYLFSADTEFSISFKNFCELWKIEDVKKKQEDGSLYREITKSLKQVMAMQFNYPRIDTGEMALSGYFSEISYSNQQFTFSIPNGIIGYIKNYGSYTWYFFENIIKLKNNAEASVLYEYINKYKHQKDITEIDGKCQFEIQIPLTKLRQILAPTAYPIVSDFCRYALKPALKAITTNTTMELELLSSVKKGRNVDGYVLSVSISDVEMDLRNAFKIERNKKSIMNEEQRIKFAMLLLSDEVYCAFEPQKEGEKVAVYLSRIRNLLKDNSYVEKIYLPFLKSTGYKNKRLDIKLGQLEVKDAEEVSEA